MNEIRFRLKALRLEMLKNNLDAWYISGTDPHLSEYLPARWETRQYISGFTGSYGMVVVTQEEAALWTDSRYFIQAEAQLKGSGLKMNKLRVPGAVSPGQWLSKKCSSHSRVGIDPQTVSVSEYRELKRVLGSSGIELIETPDLFEKIWEDRPDIPRDEIFELEVAYTGLSREEKRALIVAELKKHNAGFLVITALDELAWVFNLRGSDIPYNPVFTGFGIIGKNEYFLFVDSAKLPSEIKARLEKEKVRVQDYTHFMGWISCAKGKAVLIDPAKANQAVWNALQGYNKIQEAPSVIALLKAQKNKSELEGFRKAMKKDGVAMVELLSWLKNSVGEECCSEYTVSRKLAEFRGQQQDFCGESFPSIVGYKAHGAIVHLTVGPDDAFQLYPEGILLFDSGGQYLQGTTDITRTVALGEVSQQQKTDFTLVLKGMMALTMAVFPEGTKGANLDVLARKALWENGLNYGHGTGHGVGHFLNVHEGPVSIRQEFNPVPLKPGMVLSNEPGLYREDEYGIRTENMIVCVEKETTGFGKFLGFETLTLCPIDISLIDKNLLTEKEVDWLNSYHKKVREELKPLLSVKLQAFLEALTQPV